jgi:hypothetical protein
MNELKTHKFNEAKEQLRKFSEEIPSSITLQLFEEKFLKIFDRNVTGEKLNTLTREIQGHLISINNLHIKSIKEFGQVYNALDALDKDYILAITMAIKAAEEASNQAKESANKAKENTEDIKKTIEVQKRLIDNLIYFKEQLDKYKYLENIDKIWNDYEAFKEEIVSINNNIQQLNNDIEEQKRELCERLDENKIYHEKQIKQLSKQLKISYILAGSSIGIALISIVLNVLGII